MYPIHENSIIRKFNLYITYTTNLENLIYMNLVHILKLVLYPDACQFPFSSISFDMFLCLILYTLDYDYGVWMVTKIFKVLKFESLILKFLDSTQTQIRIICS